LCCLRLSVFLGDIFTQTQDARATSCPVRRNAVRVTRGIVVFVRQAAAAAKCDSYTCAAGHKLKTDAATTDMGATPEATCCEDDAANPAVPVSGVITFVAEAEMAEAKTAVEKMLMATLDVTNAADVMVTVASEMKMASGTRRLDGHAGVYTHTANFTVNFADFAKATTAHTALEGLTTEAAETALKEQLLQLVPTKLRTRSGR